MQVLRLQRFRVLVVAVIIFVLFAAYVALGWYREPVWTFVSLYWTEIWATVSTLTAIAMGLYHQNRWFYLLVQRYIILPFRITHSHWSFIAFYKTRDGANFDTIKRHLREKYDGHIVVRNDLQNQFEYSVDNTTFFTLQVRWDDDPAISEITLKSSYVLVPSYSYQDHMEELESLISGVGERIKDLAGSDYSLTLKFERNPYFGLLLQSLPADYIRDFKLAINVPSRDGTRVTADKHCLTVNSANLLNLSRTTLDYLSFSPKFAR